MVTKGLFIHLSIRANEMKFQNSNIKLISLQDIKQELDTTELESWQKLISILTHEIMNSIAPITSLTTTLRGFFMQQNQPVNPIEITETTIANTNLGLEIIEERGNGLLNFVENYRRLIKIPPPVFTSIPAHHWLNKLKLLFQQKLDDNKIEFDISVDTKANTLLADETLLSQVFINIINNAIDALQAG